MESQNNLQELLASDIRIQVPADTVTDIPPQPPFVGIQGVINLRNISQAKHSTVRSGFAYRSGTLAEISTEGRDVLLRTGDHHRVRSAASVGAHEVAQPYSRRHRDGVAPCAGTPGPIDLKDLAHGDVGVSGFLSVYLNVIKLSAPIFKNGL